MWWHWGKRHLAYVTAVCTEDTNTFCKT